nr:MAG TPA: hypothetical protein [Caudoviricetes sp.]
MLSKDSLTSSLHNGQRPAHIYLLLAGEKNSFSFFLYIYSGV